MTISIHCRSCGRKLRFIRRLSNGKAVFSCESCDREVVVGDRFLGDEKTLAKLFPTKERKRKNEDG